MPSLKYLNTILTVLAVLLGLSLWTAWTQSPDFVAPAHAQGIPDEGAQRKQMIDELKLLNKKVDGLQALLVSGAVRVQVQDNGRDREDEGRR
jgi:hypothetical protein